MRRYLRRFIGDVEHSPHAGSGRDHAATFRGAA